VFRLTLLLPVTVLLLVVIVWAVGFEETARQVRAAGPLAFGSVGALTLFFIVVQTLAWMLLNRPVGHRVRFRTLLEATMVGQAGNIITPSTYLGGEPLRVAYVGKVAQLPYQQVAGTVLLCKYLELLSFMLFFGFSAAVAAVEYKDVLFQPPNVVGGIGILVVAGALLGSCGLLWVSLWRRWRPLTQMVSAFARLRPLRRKVARLRHRVAEMEDQTSRVFCEEGRTSLLGFGAMLVSHVIVFVKPLAFFLLGCRLRLGMAELSLIFVTGQLLLLVQLTPSGVGMLDGGLIAVFALFGYDTADHAAMVMAYLLCLRVWDVVVISVGAVFASHVGARFFVAKPPSLTAIAGQESPPEEAEQ